MSGLHRNAEKIQQLLRELGGDNEVVQLSESTRSAAEAATALGVEPAQIAKSIIFLTRSETGEERSVLVVASGRHRICKKKLRTILGTKPRQANAEAVKRFTGYPIGGVPPLGHHLEPITLIDESLASYDVLWAAAGTPFTVFRTTFDQLVQWTGGQVSDVREDET